MALGTVVLGSAADILVSATFGGVYEPVSDMTQVSVTANRPITQTAVLQRSTAYGTPGPREVTISCTGLLSLGDTGQTTLNTAEAANTTVFMKFLWDGTNGQITECRVGSLGWGATPEALQDANYELAVVGVSTIVGTGPIKF